MARKSKENDAKQARAQKQSAMKKSMGAKKAQKAKSAQAEKVSLAPMLSVRNGADAVEFYKAAFRARELFKIADPSGAVVAQLTVGQSEFWVADESPAHLNFSPQTVGGCTSRMVMVVENPDAVFAQAVESGATVVWPVADQPYGWRVGRVVDPFGHHWEIGKPLAQGQ